jgi:hypothetical protein
MKNLIVANFPNNGKKYSELHTLIQAQCFNTKFFGWKEEDFIIVSNIDKCCDFGTWIKTDLNKNCFTGSKLFAVKYVYDMNITNESIWAHDLDAWQNSKFIEPLFLDAGFSQYSRPKINGGSQFWKKSGLDILNYTIDLINKNSSQKEEPCIQEMYYKFSKRVSILDCTYNIGCSGFVERYKKATKPIQVCHLHPTNRIAWQSHNLDRNGLGIKSVSKELEINLRKFYNLQTELDEEGLKAQRNKINARLKINK